MATITTTTSLSFDAAASLTVGVDKNFEGSIAFTSANDDVWPSFTVTKPQSKTYGPFGIAMTVVITVVNGSLDYTINGGNGGFGYDTDGNITGLVSGDGTRLYVVPLYDLPAPSAMSGTSEVVLAQFSIAAGLMGVLDRLEMRLSASKSGTSETATIRVRVGTLGTTADTVVYTSPSLLVSTNVSAGTLLDFKRSSETALQKLGSGVSTGAYGGASTVAYPAAVTVGDMDDAAYFVSVTAASSSTSETITLQDLIARLTTAA